MSKPNGSLTHARFQEANRLALTRIESVLSHWLPGGKVQKREYVVKNPARDDQNAGSFSINLDTGQWYDFASGDKGGDLVALVAYVEGCPAQADALHLLEAFMGSAPAELPTRKKADATPPDPWQPVAPIPADALSGMPKIHFKHGDPWKRWEYRDTQGALLMVIDRFNLPAQPGEDKPRKVFSPLTLWRHAGTGDTKWQRKGLPAPRPLLNLEALAKQPSAPVVVCEGEKSADAAGTLLPDYLATCWPNGTNSVSKADFSPLKGRDVVLWPDNDAGGIACMEALAGDLQALGVNTVRLVVLDHFHQVPGWHNETPTLEAGGEWHEKDDAADLLDRGWTADHLSKLLTEGVLFQEPVSPPVPAKKPDTAKRDKRKKPQQTPGFTVKDTGLYAIPEDGEPRRVCERLDIIAQTRDERGHNWGLLVEFRDPDSITKRWNIPMEALISEGAKEAISPLLSMGLKLDTKRPARNTKNDLISYLQGYAGSARARLVDRMGWHGDAYLLPMGAIGDTSEALEFTNHGAELPSIEEAGTLEDWQTHVGALCPGNDRLTLSVCVAFAGPLLHLLGLESGGFHLYGESSGGKTTHLQAAVSVYGSPKLVRSWRSTDNALESIASAHSDGLLALDEIGMCSPRIIGETVYMLGNGAGKARANDRGNGKPVRRWRLLFLSTGEKTLEQHMDEANQMHRAGMDIRMLGVPADAGAGMGLFQSLHGFANAAELSDYLKASVGNYYGTPLVKFLEALTVPENMRTIIKVFPKTLQAFEKETLPKEASGQAHRAAARFALVALAGEYATTWGATGWPAYTAWNAAKACFVAWLAERGGAGNQEETKVLDALCHLIETHGEARFSRLNVDYQHDSHAPRTVNKLGYRRTETFGSGAESRTVTTYYITPAVWAKEVWGRPGLPTARQANKVLKAHDVLQLDHEGKTSVKVPGIKGGSARYYVFTDEALYKAHGAANDEEEVKAA